MGKNPDMKHRLRQLEVLKGPFQQPDFRAAQNPQDLFLSWLDAAMAAGIREPHAMTLSTVDEDGLPDARVLILKNIDHRGWHFAISAASPKARQIAAQPAVALTFYWQDLGRQVRIRGRAVLLDRDECAQDFLARSEEARANVLLMRQSDPLDDPALIPSAMKKAKGSIAVQPDHGAEHWQVHAVAANHVEFWQGATDRLHHRMVFRRIGPDGEWQKQRLWP